MSVETGQTSGSERVGLSRHDWQLLYGAVATMLAETDEYGYLLEKPRDSIHVGIKLGQPPLELTGRPEVA